MMKRIFAACVVLRCTVDTPNEHPVLHSITNMLWK